MTKGVILFFEGSEKKAEIIIDKNSLSLLNDIDDCFWQNMVERCNAQIISSVSNSECKAFLLSESSLFVWHNKLLIITCGVTTLVDSVEYFLQHIDNILIRQVIYQRKNEYFAHAQLSSFSEDSKRLSSIIDGKAYRFGEIDSHHNYIFHQHNNFQANENNKTYQLLAYQINKQVSERLTRPNLTPACVRDFLNIEVLFPGYSIDDFVFQPYGYSLNAIRGEEYITIHITPQAMSSYVSFESNVDLFKVTKQLLSILQPASFDFLTFNESNFDQQVTTYVPEQYKSKALVKDELSNGYLVCFATFIWPQTIYTDAQRLDTKSISHAL